ncbi:MAG: hypothetical protein ACE5K0_05925 [Candidatus Methanofastidiosia archaeon]
MKCELCGFEFFRGEEACKECFLRHCNMVRCPNCGYEFIGDSNERES